MEPNLGLVIQNLVTMTGKTESSKTLIDFTKRKEEELEAVLKTLDQLCDCLVGKELTIAVESTIKAAKIYKEDELEKLMGTLKEVAEYTMDGPTVRSVAEYASNNYRRKTTRKVIETIANFTWHASIEDDNPTGPIRYVLRIGKQFHPRKLQEALDYANLLLRENSRSLDVNDVVREVRKVYC